MMNTTIYSAVFFTATNYDWMHLLQNEIHKKIIIDSLLFLKNDQRMMLYAYVIMSNHLHLIWQPYNKHTPKQIQHSFLKYTAQQIKFNLQKTNPSTLLKYREASTDREYQFWERNPLSVDLFTEKVFIQKLNYIHNNPVKAGLCRQPEEYLYSSARFYETGIDELGLLSHYKGY